MSSFKFVLVKSDNTKVWINMSHIMKMEKNTIGEYFIYLINGEKYQIDLSHARLVESYFERG